MILNNLSLHRFPSHCILGRLRQEKVRRDTTQCFKMLSNKPCHKHTEAVRQQQ